MSDDPLVMRQDPLTKLPLCPSAALKLSPVSSVLIHHLSAAVLFRHTADNSRGKRGISGVFLGRDQSKHECLRPVLKRGFVGEVIVWLKKSFVALVSDSKAAFAPNREPAGLFSRAGLQ